MSGFGSAPFGSFPFGAGASSPEVRNWQPRVDIAISRLATIEFLVTNEAWIVTDTVVRALLLGSLETVFTEAAGFTAIYRRGSARLPIANGHRFILRRTGGWPGAYVRIDVTATDLAGSTAFGQSS